MVLIPSKSGLGFLHDTKENYNVDKCLNPLEIGSRILTKRDDHHDPETARLNPLEIGSRILTQGRRLRSGNDLVLIPSKSGLGFLPDKVADLQKKIGLNPLEIGSRILTD